MTLERLLPVLHELPRADKYPAVQFLTADLAQGEGLTPGAEYPVWSPYESYEAAETLTSYLRKNGG